MFLLFLGVFRKVGEEAEEDDSEGEEVEVGGVGEELESERFSLGN